MSIRILKETRERGGWQYLARDRREFITLLGAGHLLRGSAYPPA
jgi:hypothetical protein